MNEPAPVAQEKDLHNAKAADLNVAMTFNATPYYNHCSPPGFTWYTPAETEEHDRQQLDWEHHWFRWSESHGKQKKGNVGVGWDSRLDKGESEDAEMTGRVEAGACNYKNDSWSARPPLLGITENEIYKPIQIATYRALQLDWYRKTGSGG